MGARCWPPMSRPALISALPRTTKATTRTSRFRTERPKAEMRIVAMGAEPAALIFDLDNTLYTNPAYAAYQEDVLRRAAGTRAGPERRKGRGEDRRPARGARGGRARQDQPRQAVRRPRDRDRDERAMARRIRRAGEMAAPGPEARSRPRAIGSGLRARLDDE